MRFYADSYGGSHALQEKWSDAARAAAAASRKAKGGSRRSEQEVLNRPLSGPYRKPARTAAQKTEPQREPWEKVRADRAARKQNGPMQFFDKISPKRTERNVLSRPLTGPYRKPARRGKPHIGF